MSVRKITPEYFREVKQSIRWNWSMKKVASKHGISLKTVLQIKGSKDYADYQAQNKAQHPEIKYSAQEDLFAYLKERCEQEGVQYKTPSHMSIALYQLRQMDKK